LPSLTWSPSGSVCGGAVRRTRTPGTSSTCSNPLSGGTRRRRIDRTSGRVSESSSTQGLPAPKHDDLLSRPLRTKECRCGDCQTYEEIILEK